MRRTREEILQACRAPVVRRGEESEPHVLPDTRLELLRTLRDLREQALLAGEWQWFEVYNERIERMTNVKNDHS